LFCFLFRVSRPTHTHTLAVAFVVECKEEEEDEEGLRIPLPVALTALWIPLSPSLLLSPSCPLYPTKFFCAAGQIHSDPMLLPGHLRGLSSEGRAICDNAISDVEGGMYGKREHMIRVIIR